MFPTTISRDVGMVDGVSDATGSSMEKPTGGKKSRNKEVYRDSVTTRSTFAGIS